ncbi:MAG: hypothetical protein EP335_09095 [Alphaproteobacteria bacterium]|nr:MAG: hypothetical protein EP335_09095 [Alphaproteobacteria bacterium]
MTHPFRRRAQAMQRFPSAETLQKFASGHARLSNHFNCGRHLIERQTCRALRAAILVAWRMLPA